MKTETVRVYWDEREQRLQMWRDGEIVKPSKVDVTIEVGNGVCEVNNFEWVVTVLENNYEDPKFAQHRNR